MSPTGASDDVADRLPLRPVALAALAALARGPRPGVEILEAVNEAAPSHPILGPGTLYRLLRELRQDGWVERVDPPPSAHEDDDRRRYHALTPAGRAALAAEAERLRRTLAPTGLLEPRGRTS
jgi:DNA-binding PadR family transcriptional regulator